MTTPLTNKTKHGKLLKTYAPPVGNGFGSSYHVFSLYPVLCHMIVAERFPPGFCMVQICLPMLVLFKDYDVNSDTPGFGVLRRPCIASHSTA